MTSFDYLVLFVLICSILISTMRGLVKEILSLLGWIVSLVVANAYGEALAGMLPAAIPGYATRLIVAFIALFLGVKLLMMLLTKAVDALVRAGGLTVADRGLGGMGVDFLSLRNLLLRGFHMGHYAGHVDAGFALPCRVTS